MAALAASTATGFAVADRLTIPFTRLMRRLNILSADVHKNHEPKIPDMGGALFLFGLAASSSLAAYLLPQHATTLLAFLLVAGVAGLVGLVDHLKPFGGVQKTVVTAAASAPIVMIGVYTPSLDLPFIGGLRITILYPALLVPVMVALTANATNMIDVLNGSMAGTITVASIFLIGASIILGRPESLLLFTLIAACTAAFYRHNRYPARIFAGDVGSLSIGAAVGAAAIAGRMEVVTLIALLPLMVNGSLNLSSVGRLFERRELAERPTRLLPDGRLAANPNPRAPITLTRLILAKGPLREDEIVRHFLVLTLFSGVLALLTAAIMAVD